MTKLHVIRELNSGFVIAERQVREGSTVYEPDAGTVWWLDGVEYVVDSITVWSTGKCVTVYVQRVAGDSELLKGLCK